VHLEALAALVYTASIDNGFVGSPAREQGSVREWACTPTPRVVVGIPAYNFARWLNSTIASWHSQTWSDFRLTIRDKAPTDCSFSICQKFARRDPCVVIHR
jgi:hypothetical protein